jgi:hypothetical protein
MPAEAGATDFAILAVHCDCHFGHRFHILILQQSLAVMQALIFTTPLFLCVAGWPKMGLSERFHEPIRQTQAGYLIHGGGGIGITSLLGGQQLVPAGRLRF